MSRRARARKRLARWFGPRRYKTIEGQHHFEGGIKMSTHYTTYRTRFKRRLVVVDTEVVIEGEKAA